jgi:hypothetical protein
MLREYKGITTIGTVGFPQALMTSTTLQPSNYLPSGCKNDCTRDNLTGK